MCKAQRFTTRRMCATMWGVAFVYWIKKSHLIPTVSNKCYLFTLPPLVMLSCGFWSQCFLYSIHDFHCVSCNFVSNKNNSSKNVNRGRRDAFHETNLCLKRMRNAMQIIVSFANKYLQLNLDFARRLQCITDRKTISI